MAFALLSRPKRAAAVSSTPARKRKPVPGQHTIDSCPRFEGFAARLNAASLPMAPVIQAKLKIGEPNDKFEQEADRVAEEVMRMPEPQALERGATSGSACPTRIQRVCRECEEGLSRRPVAVQRMCPECEKELQRQPVVEEEEEDTIQAKETSGRTPEVTPDVQAQINGLQGSGLPLPKTVRAFFEPRFGYDFSGVQVHSDARAAEAARAVNARAFTVGREVVFGAGEYVPGTATGRHLLAHELTHVVQQGGTAVQQASVPTNDDEGRETATNVPADDVRRPPRQEASAHIQSLNRPGIKASVPDGNSSVQRVADKSNPPSNMPCDRVDTGPGGPVGTHVVFGQAGQTLDQADRELIAAEFKAWQDRGSIDTITVHGFASSEGAAGLNWRLSCNRAEIVKAELMRLGGTTFPANMVVTIAHGETEEFSATEFPPNRRAVIRVVPTARPTSTGDCPTTITENTTLTSHCDNGIEIAADNVILDCAGHTLTGTGGGSGILLAGRSGVRVVNCRVTNFRNGFGLRQIRTPGAPPPPRGTPAPGTKSSRNTFTNNTAFRNSADGFDLNDSPNNTFIQNVANDNTDHGFELDFSGENLLVGNTANRNGDGFDVSGINRNDAAPSPNNTFVNNTADSNRESGFRISSDGNTLRGNTANNSVGVPDTRPGRTGTRRGDGFRIEGNNNTLSGNSGSGNRQDLDVRNNTSGNTCTGSSFGTTNGQCPPDFP